MLTNLTVNDRTLNPYRSPTSWPAIGDMHTYPGQMLNGLVAARDGFGRVAVSFNGIGLQIRSSCTQTNVRACVQQRLSDLFAGDTADLNCAGYSDF